MLVVEPFAVPPAGGGAPVDRKAHRLVLAGELDDVSAETSLEAGGTAFEGYAVGVAEDQFAVFVGECRAALVDEGVRWQSRTRLSSMVSPPSTQCRMWCASSAWVTSIPCHRQLADLRSGPPVPSRSSFLTRMSWSTMAPTSAFAICLPSFRASAGSIAPKAGWAYSHREIHDDANRGHPSPLVAESIHELADIVVAALRSPPTAYRSDCPPSEKSEDAFPTPLQVGSDRKGPLCLPTSQRWAHVRLRPFWRHSARLAARREAETPSLPSTSPLPMRPANRSEKRENSDADSEFSR